MASLRGAFADPAGRLRLVLLPLGIGYLLAQHAGEPAIAADWVLTIVAGLVASFGGRFPLAVAVIQAGLVVAVDQYGAMPVPVKVVASLALVDLAIRHSPRLIAIGAAALTTAYALVLPEGDGLGGLIYRLIIVVLAPVLLGAYLRSARDSARQARLAAAAELARRDALVAEARREQRTAIARELHDIVAHHLASMVIRVGVVRHVIPEVDPRVAAVLDDVHHGAGTALADLRRLLGVLRGTPDDANPLPIEPGQLPEALRNLAERSRLDGLNLTVEVDDEVSRLDPLQALTVLRLVQEGLTNVLKHAGPGVAARLTVSAADGVQVQLTNEIANIIASGNGYGLVGLDERVALVGGSFQAGPTPGGWRLAAHLPVEPVRDEAVL